MASFTDFSDSNCTITEKPAPSYLKHLTRCDENVLLIYRTVDTRNDEAALTTIEDTNVSLDLTGNPLEIDLNAGDCTMNMSVNCVTNLWHANETEYGSLDLRTIRKLINSELTKRHLRDNIYIYGLCNGKDKNRTVILGAHQTDDTLCHTQVFIKGISLTDDNVNQSLENMKKEHYKNASNSNGLETKITHVITGTYILHGHRISQNPLMLNSKFSGSISCDVTWSTFQYTVPKFVDSIELTVQVIASHKKSQLHSYWNQLMLLKNYINLLSKQHNDLDSVILNESHKDNMDIVASYDAVFAGTQTAWRPLPTEEKTTLNFDNLRWEIFTDKLWELLIYCGTVHDLRFCLHSLFEELVTSKLPLNARDFPAHDKSFISKILIETSNGRIAVPTLSLNQALTCLIELGVEKLKRDYFYILNCCNCLSPEEIVQYWESATQQDKLARTTIASKSTSRTTVAKARFTVAPTMAILDSHHCLNKFKCLLSMHVASDVLTLMIKWPCLQYNVIDKIRYGLLNKEINVTISKPLFEVKVKVGDNKLESLKLQNPVALNIKFRSSNRTDTVETVFHHTTEKLFPPAVFDSYEATNVCDGASYYYITELVRYTTKLF